MALVTVIVAIGFVAALVSILLMTTLVNFKMKVVNEKGTDTFYSAEQVMDEITVGLQRVVSDALSSSYTTILENYGDSSLDNNKKKQMVQVKYYEKLWEALAVAPDNHTKYDVTKLEGFLKESTKYHEGLDLDGDGTVGPDEGFGAILVAVVNDPSTGDEIESTKGDMLTFSNTGVVLKNLKVYYRDVNGFVSVIQTDIRLNYPDFDFAKNSAIADISDYCFIADGGAEDTASAGTLNINGNIYANSFSTSGPTRFDSENLVLVKHDINISSKNGSMTTGSGCTIWADNLTANSSKLDINGGLNLSNDLNLKGDKPSIKLVGEFNAYGNSITDAGKSSAVLINGAESTVDFSRVNKLKISGRAFLGTKPKTTNSGATLAPSEVPNHFVETELSSYNDIYTGESLAAKSDQLMYLVPPEVIGVDEKSMRSLYGSNPLTRDEYNSILEKVTYDENNSDTSDTHYVLISDTASVPALGGTIASYVKYGANSKPQVYTHKVRVNDESVGYLVYFYMLFPDENVANDYFKKYYENSEIALGKYTKKYVKEVKLPVLMDTVTAGNVYVSDSTDPTDADGVIIWSQTQLSANTIMQQDYSDNLQRFQAYATKLIPNYSELRGCTATIMDDPTRQVVFENVVTTEDKIEEYINRADAGGCNGQEYDGIRVDISSDKKMMTFTDVTVPDGPAAIVAIKDVTVPNNPDHKVNLIITTGNVNVPSSMFNFDGVIICDKKLTIQGNNMTMTKSADLVRKCLQYGYEESGLTYAIASCLANGNDYIYSALGNGGVSDTSLTGLVTYENWKKE